MSLVYLVVGVLTAVGSALTYLGNPRPVVGPGVFAIPAVLLAVGFALRRPRRPPP